MGHSISLLDQLSIPSNPGAQNISSFIPNPLLTYSSTGELVSTLHRSTPTFSARASSLEKLYGFKSKVVSEVIF